MHRLDAQAFLLGEDLGQLLFTGEQVAPAARNDVDHRLARGFRGPHGVLVGVDVDAFVGVGELGTFGVCEMRLGEDRQAGQR